MTSFRLLPPTPRPPHDPTSLSLSGSTGWRAAVLDDVAIDASGALTLAVTSGGRALDEPSGSFGGLVPPELVAVGEGCDVWLLDRVAATLKKFDDCDCRFVDVPCFGGVGSGPRQLTDARSIAIARANLFVADAAAQRVSVFALRGYVLRGVIAPPTTEFPQPWTPVSVAADPRGAIYVADVANGAVHRFAPHGAWERAIVGVGAVQHIAVDCRGWVYVVTATSHGARVFDSRGDEQAPATDVAVLRGRFPALPFKVDRDGALEFTNGCGTFDAHGAPLPGAALDSVRFTTDGTFRTKALDSGIAECQWHRVIIEGSIPAGTRVVVSTRSTEVDEPDAIVDDLPDDAWDTWQTARKSEGTCVAWDCLVRSGPGRYLHLRLRLVGDGRATPMLRRVTVAFPRISLSRYLPPVFSSDPATADFTDRFLSIFDTTLRSIEKRVDEQSSLFDARSAPAERGPRGEPDFLSWIASWIGLSLNRQWPEERRRRYLHQAPKLFAKRGTVAGLRETLLLYLGLDSDRAPALVLEHWTLRRWLFVGAARLGEQAMVWGKSIVNRSRLDDGARADVTRLIGTPDPYRDPFHTYASTFTVFVPACVAKDATARKGLENLLRDESPAHTRWHLELVEPRFRIGVQSMIGYDSVVGRYPKPDVTLDTTTLGRSTILGGVADDTHGPSMRVGRTSRVGSTTRLL